MISMKLLEFRRREAGGCTSHRAACRQGVTALIAKKKESSSGWRVSSTSAGYSAPALSWARAHRRGEHAAQRERHEGLARAWAEHAAQRKRHERLARARAVGRRAAAKQQQAIGGLGRDRPRVGEGSSAAQVCSTPTNHRARVVASGQQQADLGCSRAADAGPAQGMRAIRPDVDTSDQAAKGHLHRRVAERGHA